MPAGTGARTSAVSAAIAAARAGPRSRRRAPRAPPRSARRAAPGSARRHRRGRRARERRPEHAAPFPRAKAPPPPDARRHHRPAAAVLQPSPTSREPPAHAVRGARSGILRRTSRRWVQQRDESLPASGPAARARGDVLESDLRVEREAGVDHDLVAEERSHREALAGRGDAGVGEMEVEQLAAHLHAVPEVADDVDADLAAASQTVAERPPTLGSVYLPAPAISATPTLSCTRASPVSSTTGRNR